LNNDLEEFLTFLYQGQTGFVYSPVKRVASGEWDQRFFYWPIEKDNLRTWIQSEAHAGDVYIGPALFREKIAKKEYVAGAQVVWTEFDGNVNLEGVPTPAWTIRSSTDSHLHVYWKTPWLPREVVENINRRITYGLGADSSSWDSTQVLRPPGTANHKHSPALNVNVKDRNVLAETLDPVYFDKFPEPPSLILIEDISGLPSVNDVLSAYSIPKKARDFYNKATVEKGLRSGHLMQLGYELAAVGMKHDEIMTLLLNVDIRIEKFAGRHDQLVRLSEIASIAIAKYGMAQKVPYYSPLELMALDVEFESYWKHYIPATGNLMITGSPGVGKTQLAFQLGMCFSTGREILGEAPKLLDVVFFSFEMPVIGIKWLLGKQLAAFTEEEKKVMNEHFVIYPLGYPMPLGEMEKRIQEHKATGYFIDSLSTLAQDTLIDEREASRILGWDSNTRQQSGVFSVVIHHNRKENGDRRPARLSDVYGSYLFGARFDSVVCLWKDPGKAGPHGTYKESKGTELIELKTRYGEEGVYSVERSEFMTWGYKTAPPVEEPLPAKVIDPVPVQSVKIEDGTGLVLDFGGTS